MFKRGTHTKAIVQDVLDVLLLELDDKLFGIARNELRFVDEGHLVPTGAEVIDHALATV